MQLLSLGTNSFKDVFPQTLNLPAIRALSFRLNENITGFCNKSKTHKARALGFGDRNEERACRTAWPFSAFHLEK